MSRWILASLAVIAIPACAHTSSPAVSTAIPTGRVHATWAQTTREITGTHEITVIVGDTLASLLASDGWSYNADAIEVVLLLNPSLDPLALEPGTSVRLPQAPESSGTGTLVLDDTDKRTTIDALTRASSGWRDHHDEAKAHADAKVL